MERWIEITDGIYPDGYPRTRYRHESCQANEMTLACVYPYCPYCGKRVSNVRILNNGFQEIVADYLKEQGFIVE